MLIWIIKDDKIKLYNYDDYLILLTYQINTLKRIYYLYQNQQQKIFFTIIGYLLIAIIYYLVIEIKLIPNI